MVWIHQGGLVSGSIEERRTEERQDLRKLCGPEEEMNVLDLNDRFGLSTVFCVPRQKTVPTLSCLELKTALGENSGTQVRKPELGESK